MRGTAQLAPVRRRADVLKDATVRDFSGGWNVVDNDLNLSTKFAVVLDNMSREEDGSLGVRWGTQLFADLDTALSSANFPDAAFIVNHTYFQGSIVVNLSNGNMARVLGDGTTTVIWNTTIAGGLVGSPAGWGPTNFVSYAVFNGKLIVCNGTDKPLIIDFDNVPPVQYLADEGTGSNANTPICRYVVAMNRYVVMAGDALFPDRVHVSCRDTSGTWSGDAAPNDATYVDLGKVGVQGDQMITGINRYRDQLVVGFLSAAVLGTLGAYETIASVSTHVPSFKDVIEGYGCHSHRSMINLGNDLFILDHQGITSLARSLYSGSTEPKRVSELIDPKIAANVTRLVEVDTVLGAHAVYNSNDKQYMCFIPNHSEDWRDMLDNAFEVMQDNNGILTVHIPDHGVEIGDVVEFKGVTNWNTIVAATTLNNIRMLVVRVISQHIFVVEPDGLVTDPNGTIMGGGTAAEWRAIWTETIGYIYTFVNELKIRAWARYRGWRWRSSCVTSLGNIMFADDKRLYLYGNVTHPLHSDFIGTDDARDIAFAYEMPWTDFDKRAHEKHIRYMQLDTVGHAHFTMSMFVDMIYDYLGQLYPNNTMEFVAGSSGGYGEGPGTFGGGRRTSDQRLFSWTARGKLFKWRIQGITDKKFNTVSITALYQDGSIRR